MKSTLVILIFTSFLVSTTLAIISSGALPAPLTLTPSSNANSTAPPASRATIATATVTATTTIYHKTAIHHGLTAAGLMTDLPAPSAYLQQQKYWISTYYSCNTRWDTVHCGTHEQVLKGTGPNGESLPAGGQPLQTSPASSSAAASAPSGLFAGAKEAGLLILGSWVLVVVLAAMVW
ncbi:hypothetical protein PVAG01_06742 [Phlyctema vagabunda]|uniref:Uncharacterized protein n=1 Tax=Phlyctema vagabunda TaxID=108571 RepID=A0ABR4PHW8_9HELO